ncbi:MAG TPA: cupin domain-containing protein [Microvirga sp.]|nr:cupin domain-containing protein [Microvirga sp.]
MAESKGYGQPNAYNAPLGTDTFVFRDDGLVPNSTLPLVVRRGAIPPSASDPAKAFEATFQKNGWSNAWRNGIEDYHHYHSNAHEVLGIAVGSATVRFGGEGGETVGVTAGDVVIVPAGVAHALIKASDDFLVVGAYAGGRDPNELRDDPGAITAARQSIARVPLPDADPVDGPTGPLTKLWR